MGKTGSLDLRNGRQVFRRGGHIRDGMWIIGFGRREVREQEYFCYGSTYSAFRVKVKPSLGQGLILIPLFNWNMDHLYYSTKEIQGQKIRSFSVR